MTLEINLEMLGAVTSLIVVATGGIWWCLKTYASYKVKETTEDLSIDDLSKRVASLELDIKELADANVQLSNIFHTEINKILHKLAGGAHE